ncbi:MAG: hypothetical protein R8K20_10720 [Gallionellaceae bacterium]
MHKNVDDKLCILCSYLNINLEQFFNPDKEQMLVEAQDILLGIWKSQPQESCNMTLKVLRGINST